MINYAPYIEGIIPAFSLTINIPFKMNAAVSASQVKGFLVKFMNLDGTYIGLQAISTNISEKIQKEKITFELRSGLQSKITAGNFYKIQLAYMDTTTWSNGDIYTYSTVGVIKRTKAYSQNPTWINSGEYTNNLQFNSYKVKLITYDINEPIYEYKFIIKNPEGAVVYNTDYMLHNSEKDKIEKNSSNIRYREATLACQVDKVLDANNYTIYCYVKTINGLYFERHSVYTKKRPESYPISVTDFIYEQIQSNKECGTIKITYVPPKTGTGHYGTYMVKRKSSKDGFSTWQTISNFVVNENNKNETKIKYDYSIEQGETYIYVLVKYQNGIAIASQHYTKNGTETKDKKIVPDFDFTFLCDKNQNLNIGLNSNVTFKQIIQEAKVDTIGSRFPYFYRNGDVNYREFNISGLISYETDPYEVFISIKDLTQDQYVERPSNLTNLSEQNFFIERKFRTEVFKWLTNGQPKLLKSPTEGNAIVRLSNVSLAPFSGTSNMVSTFSATATEIADFDNFNELIENGVIGI